MLPALPIAILLIIHFKDLTILVKIPLNSKIPLKVGYIDDQYTFNEILEFNGLSSSQHYSQIFKMNQNVITY